MAAATILQPSHSYFSFSLCVALPLGDFASKNLSCQVTLTRVSVYRFWILECFGLAKLSFSIRVVRPLADGMKRKRCQDAALHKPSYTLSALYGLPIHGAIPPHNAMNFSTFLRTQRQPLCVSLPLGGFASKNLSCQVTLTRVSVYRFWSAPSRRSFLFQSALLILSLLE